MRILLVEDHPQLAESVVQALKGAGWTVDLLQDGVAADLALASEEYALAILDVGLPRMDGFEVLARLRGRGKTLPVLMLTARGEVKDRVHGLNLGADDYLAKPFELSELEARVKALLRRSVLGGEQLQRCGALVYDLGTRRFSLDEQPLTLTSREQAVLEAMIARPGRGDEQGATGRPGLRPGRGGQRRRHRDLRPPPAQEAGRRRRAHRHLPRPRLPAGGAG
ncbi:two-component response regulator [Pseudomonas aeruginosa]|nr:two-component response regulator [Pseudomonas aeruginosa]